MKQIHHDRLADPNSHLFALKLDQQEKQVNINTISFYELTNNPYFSDQRET